ncbi:MAG: DUF6789 family protein [Bacillota bacterium]
MHVKLTRVIISGFTGGLAMFIPDYSLYLLGINKFRNLDWASIIAFGHTPMTTWESIFGEITNLIWTMLLGVVFVYIASRIITSSKLYLRGFIYGVAMWFIINALAVMYKLPDLYLTFGSVITNLISAIVYGLVLATMLRLLDKDLITD